MTQNSTRFKRQVAKTYSSSSSMLFTAFWMAVIQLVTITGYTLRADDPVKEIRGTSSVSNYDDMEKSARWAKKIRPLFNNIDENNDGYINRTECVDSSVDRARVYFGSKKILEFQDAANEHWDNFWATPDNGFKDTYDFDDYVTLIQRMATTDGLRREVRLSARELFDSADVGENGHLNPQEYSRLMQVFSVPSGDWGTSFNLVDVDGSGAVEKEELVKAWVDFFYNHSVDFSLLFGTFKYED